MLDVRQRWSAHQKKEQQGNGESSLEEMRPQQSSLGVELEKRQNYHEAAGQLGSSSPESLLEAWERGSARRAKRLHANDLEESLSGKELC